MSRTPTCAGARFQCTDFRGIERSTCPRWALYGNLKGKRGLFKTILDEEGLRFDREGQPRTAYSLRHTYICLRLMEGADIYQIAKNCRTSVKMIEK